MLVLNSYHLVEDEEFLKFYKNIKPKLPLSLMEKIDSFKFSTDMQRSLIAHLIVLQFYAKLLNKNINEIQLKYNEHEKPSLKNIDGHFFNISHSGNQVVVVFSDKEVGVDVEKIKGDRRKIAQRFFTKGEISDMRKAGIKDEQILYFYQLWTLKESYMKALGRGINMSLRSFAFKKQGEEFKLAFSAHDEDWFFHSPKWDNGYYLSVCSRYNDVPLVEERDINCIIRDASFPNKP